MNQIVITLKNEEEKIFKVSIMGEGRTNETFYMTKEILDDCLSALLRKLKLNNDL
jgi:hypothetical protein